MDGVKSWVDTLKPPDFTTHNDPDLDPSILARMAAIPREYLLAVERIKLGRSPDGSLFREFRKAWHEEKKSAFLWGPMGIGKSISMAWACVKCVEGGGRICWIDVPEIPQMLRSAKRDYKSNLLEDGKTARLCIIDDAHRAADIWETERNELTSLINHRYKHGKHTLMSATLNIDKTKNIIGADSLDRFPYKLEGTGSSYR